MLILTVRTQDSTWVRKELDAAINAKKVVIPFMVEAFDLNDTFRFLLSDAQWCYAYQDRSTALKKLVAGIRCSPAPYGSTPIPNDPPAPGPKPQCPRCPACGKYALIYKDTEGTSVFARRTMQVFLMWSVLSLGCMLVVGLVISLPPEHEAAISNNPGYGVAGGIFMLVLVVVLAVRGVPRKWIEKVIGGSRLHKVLFYGNMMFGAFFTLIGVITFPQFMFEFDIMTESQDVKNVILAVSFIGSVCSPIAIKPWLQKGFAGTPIYQCTACGRRSRPVKK